jgi:hypothetical protein
MKKQSVFVLAVMLAVFAPVMIGALAAPSFAAMHTFEESDPCMESGNSRPDSNAAAAAITVEKLADICEAMESAIIDISMQYEWYVEPPMTVEDIAGTGMLINKGHPKYQWTTARPFGERVLFISSTTIMNAEGDSWDSVIKQSYNGKIAKHLQIEKSTLDGVVHSKPYMIGPTPMEFFSVLRLSMSKPMENIPLSAWLRDKEFVQLDNTVEKIDGFNTIRADFLTHTNDPNANKMVYLRVYFSVEHGYTPVRYEHGIPKSNNILTFEVNSLEQVAEGLWFPSSGTISSPDDKRMNVYRATSKILVNQGLADGDFDIEFPPGTKVRDEIRGTEYIVKPTKEQKEKFEKEKQWVKEHAEEIAAMEKEGGRIYSAARLMKLRTAIDLYMTDNDKKFPQTLDDLKLYFGDKDKETFSWLLKNVEYLGSDLEPDKVDISKTPIAYDKTLLKKGEGTNVLFVNGLVEFCKPARLKKLGIKVP